LEYWSGDRLSVVSERKVACLIDGGQYREIKIGQQRAVSIKLTHQIFVHRKTRAAIPYRGLHPFS